jgi:predicted kinase
MDYLKKYGDFINEISKNEPIPEIYQKNKLAVFLIGPPASGKSNIISNILSKNPQFNMIDPDVKSGNLIKKLDKVKSQLKSRVAYSNFVNTVTNKVEEFARIKGIQKELASQFVSTLYSGSNVIYNSTGNNKQLLTSFIEEAKKFDYKILFIHVLPEALEDSIKMSKLRANEIGRPVDVDYLVDTYQGTNELKNYYHNLADDYYVIWNRYNKAPKYYKIIDGDMYKKRGNKWVSLSDKRIVVESSKYYDEDDLNKVLDKISKSGMNSLTDIEKNILSSISSSDERINDIIRLMSECSRKCKHYMELMRNNEDGSLESNKRYLDEWAKYSRELSRYEHMLKDRFGLNLTDYKLNNESVKVGTEMHAFDMDGTLIDSPHFSTFYENGLPDSSTDIGKIIDKELEKVECTREDVKIENKRITVPKDKAPNWHTIGDRAIMPKPHDYYTTPESLGNDIYKDIKDLYDSSKNVSIITGRNESISDSVKKHLSDIGFKLRGEIYLSPTYDNIAEWKAGVLKDMLNQYDTVYFYEDKLSWIKEIREIIMDESLRLIHVENGKIIGEY